MNIPPCVIKQINDDANKYDNKYFYKAEESWGRLTDIYSGKVSFIADDIASLANTLERYYKSLLLAKIKHNPAYAEYCTTKNRSMNDRDFLYTHYLPYLQKEIETQIAPLFDYMLPHEKRESVNFFSEFSRQYMLTRYEVTPFTKADFDSLYEVTNIQRDRIMDIRQHEEYLAKPHIDLSETKYADKSSDVHKDIDY